MAILLVCLLLTSSAGWAFTPPATRDWCIAYYLKDKAEGYTEYVKKYPDSPYREKAVYRKAVKTEQPQDYRDYLKEYGQNPNAQFKVEAQDALRTMETKQMEVIKKHPYVGDIRKFIHDFPDSKYLKELLLMIESNPVLKTLLLTEIEQALKQAENPPAPSVVTQVSNYSDPAYQGARETREHPNLAPKGSLTTAASDMNAPQAANLSSAIVNNDQIQSPAVNYPITPGMVFVSGGTFQMGGNEYYDEKHIHQVTLSGFEIGKYEVTQTEWVAIMGSNPSRFAGCGNCPVENIAWNDIQQFLKKLNEKYPGKNYRLPTEAEWEYAARGGAQGAMNNLMTMYAGSESLDQIAWYSGNSGDRTHPVGQKKPNLLGLYDMCGNVYEWCNDWFGDYSVKAQNNPNGPKSGSFRVQRGGAWDVKPEDCRVANRRHRSGTIFRRDNYGFRLARTPNY
jgi:formylglycine-generating enzyme required for sulfatase activity